jgi:NADH dehydrogenase (ubiquinone) 1 alpha subcomplex subunit 9
VSGIVATVFGATGFIGKAVVEQLGSIGSQIITPFRGDGMNVRYVKVMGDLGQIVPMSFKMHDEDSIRDAVARSNVVINLIGSDKETRNYSYHDTNVKIAYRLAKISKEMGVKRFIHASAAGADINSDSQYLATKAESEEVVRKFFPDATVMRLCPVYGLGDSFLNRWAQIHNTFSTIPLINNGEAKLQPVDVRDVMQAFCAAIKDPNAEGKTYHIGGDEVMTQAELHEYIDEMIFNKCHLVPMGLTPALVMGWITDKLPLRFQLFNPDLVTRQQHDAIVPTSGDVLTLKDLNITPFPFRRGAAQNLVVWRQDRGPSRFGTVIDEDSGDLSEQVIYRDAINPSFGKQWGKVTPRV